MKHFMEVIREECLLIAEEFQQEKKDIILRASQKYNEHFIRLEKRYQGLLRIEKAKELIDLEELDKQGRTLEDLQLEFVDKTEAFYQQIYAAISTFVLLLSHVGGHKFKGQLPIKSISRFLIFITEWFPSDSLRQNAKILKISIDFRSKYVDHPQQHVLHDWMTYSYGTGTCIIYFIRTGNGVYVPEIFNPYDPNFKPPVDHEDFYISPPHTVVFKALQDFSIETLSSLKSR